MIYQANPDTSNENHDIKYTKKNNIFSLQTNKNILQRVPLNIFQNMAYFRITSSYEA